MRKALVSGGVAMQVAEFNPDNVPSWASDWVDVADSVGVGSVWDGSAWSDPPEPNGTPEGVKAEMLRRTEAGKSFSITGYAQPVLVEGTQSNTTDLIIRERQVGLGALTVNWVSGGVTHTLTNTQFLELFGLALSHGEALRQDMHTLLAMDPIPSDFREDSYWTQ